VSDREKTGSISKVTADVISNQPVSNPLQAMQGRMPGVYISQDSGIPGSNFTVKIRGQNSLTSGNDPLYIVDGIPFISQAITPNYGIGTGLYGSKYGREDFGSGTSPLNSINPNDIESITVLKDADATAIYGSRGANGVVLITTKKGKAGVVKFDVNLKTGISKVIRRVPLLNTKQYLAMRMEAVQNDGDAAPGALEYDINDTWDQDRYTDWLDVLIGGSAQMTDITTSVSAGSKDTHFLFSAGYNEQGMVFPGDDKVRRFSTLFSVSNTSPNKKFTSSFSTSYTLNNNNILAKDLTSLALYLAPNSPAVYDENGKLNWENSTWQNPLAYLENQYADKTYNLLSNAQLGYEIIKGLKFKGSVGFNDIRNTLQETNLSTSYRPVENLTAADSYLTTASGATQSWIIEPLVNWDTKVGKARLSILVGGSYQFRVAESTRQKFRGFSSNALVNSPNSASVKEGFAAGNSEYKYAALYARANYTWDEKYILNLTGRRDGSSRFGPGKKFANFGALGLAWIFSNEDFVKSSIPFLSFGKVRGSYGQTGNDQIGDYRYLDTYAYQSQYQGIGDLGPSKLYDPDFSWEVNEKLEGAIELGFLNDRILLTTAYFVNRSSSQLVEYQLAATAGFPGVTKNSPATVQNTGLELELTTINVSKGEWKWTTSANISFPRNKLIAFPNLESSSYATTYVIGKSLNIWRAWHYQGVDPSTGLYKAQDINEDGQLTDADRIHVFEFKQNYYGGLNNSLFWKGLQLDIFFQFASRSGKLPTYGVFTGSLDPYGNGNTSLHQLGANIFDGRWQQPGDNATTQRFSRGLDVRYGEEQFTESNAVAGDWYYIRLKNISVSYQVPEKILKGMKCRVYVQGQNLFTVTDYPGLDPETGGDRLPPLATILGGLQLTF
jgi:TonB-linked SusC/RagA family outer membrane protein